MSRGRSSRCPTRAWELAIGATPGGRGGPAGAAPATASTAAGWLGLGMIAASGLVIDTSTPFPGLAAVLPTVGCALAMLPGMASQASIPARLLGWAPARFMGRISYSLYLWHWPLLVLPLAVAGGTLPLVGARRPDGPGRPDCLREPALAGGSHPPRPDRGARAPPEPRAGRRPLGGRRDHLLRSRLRHHAAPGRGDGRRRGPGRQLGGGDGRRTDPEPGRRDAVTRPRPFRHRRMDRSPQA